MNIVQQYTSTISQIYDSVTKRYKHNIDLIKSTEGQLQDLMHECELADPKNAAQGYKMYKQIRELRQQRRIAKDENQLLEEFYTFLQSNQAFKNKVQQIQGSSVKVCEAQEHRRYYPRTQNGMAINGAPKDQPKPFEDMMKDFKKTQVRSVGGKYRK